MPGEKANLSGGALSAVIERLANPEQEPDELLALLEKFHRGGFNKSSDLRDQLIGALVERVVRLTARVNNIDSRTMGQIRMGAAHASPPQAHVGMGVSAE